MACHCGCLPGDSSRGTLTNMLSSWPKIANCYLRSREEDCASALILSVGFGLAVAGTIACAMRPCNNLIARLAAVSYPATMAFMMAMAAVYYISWGSWIRRRLRQPLRITALACGIAACSPICFGSGAPSLIAVALMLSVTGLALWAALKSDVTAPTDSTAGLMWTIAFMISNVLFAVVRLEYASWSIFAGSITLLVLGAIMYCMTYRRWYHAAWHVFLIAASCAHYASVWQHLM
jgi:predicted membrane channel-forming protein YqfA (hemolysin III family)